MALHWEPRLATGVREIDEQHQELFRQVNGLLAAMREQRGSGEVGHLLDFLARYVLEHFGAEERLMVQSRYPGYDPHRREHADFVQDFQALLHDFRAHGASPAIVVRLNVWLCGWLRRHVSDSDQAMGRWLVEHAVPASRGPAQ